MARAEGGDTEKTPAAQILGIACVHWGACKGFYALMVGVHDAIAYSSVQGYAINSIRATKLSRIENERREHRHRTVVLHHFVFCGCCIFLSFSSVPFFFPFSLF